MSHAIGFGHFFRCLALAQALHDAGHESHFSMSCPPPAVAAALERESITLISSTATRDLLFDAKELISLARTIKADWIVTDGYQFSTEFQRAIKDAGGSLLCIDDIAAFPFVSDFVLNQNLNAERICHYQVYENTRLLLGSRYILLRREFADSCTPTKTINQRCDRVLVTMGGSDPAGLSKMALRALNEINEVRLHVRIIIGPGFRGLDQLSDLVVHSSHDMELVHQPIRIDEHMRWCDLAVAAAGTTTWELASFCTPMVLCIAAENQRIIAEEMSRAGAAMKISQESLNAVAIAEAIMRLVTSRNLRVAFSDRCRELFDGMGARRVIEELIHSK